MPNVAYRFVKVALGFAGFGQFLSCLQKLHRKHDIFCSDRDIFTVKEKPNANNLAYTSGYLALHTDQPYYATQPDVSINSIQSINHN